MSLGFIMVMVLFIVLDNSIFGKLRYFQFNFVCPDNFVAGDTKGGGCENRIWTH